MIKNTFRHFKTIGQRSESDLWKRGIFTWDDYLDHYPQQLRLFDSIAPSPDVQSSLDAFERRDIDYFANFLHKHEYYRLAFSFPEKVIFLDIETTGLSVYYDIITLVGWSVGSEYGVFINGDDESKLLAKLKEAKIIVTFIAF